MRVLVAAVVLCGFVSGAYGAPSDKQLLDAVQQANSECRGLPPDEREEACQKRDQLVGRLTERGYCYGLKGQVGADMRWHRCGPRSQRLEDQP